MIHFIAGLPRSGSTLLRALLEQNPRFGIGVQSPLFFLLNGLVAAMGADHPLTRLSDLQRENILQGLLTGIYADRHQRVIFDTNRLWTGRLPLLKQLLPDCRILCCVRNPAWVLDSYERLYRKNPTYQPISFSGQESLNVYARAEALMDPKRGGVGTEWRALREAWYMERERLIVIEYDELCEAPHRVMHRIHEELKEEHFFYDYENLGLVPDSYCELDDRAGFPGLHQVEGPVAVRKREPVIPPDLFARYKGLAFWESGPEPRVPSRELPGPALRILET